MSKLPLLLHVILSLVSSSWAQVDATTIKDQLNITLDAAIDEFEEDIYQKSVPDHSVSYYEASFTLTSNRVTSFKLGTAWQKMNVQEGLVSLQVGILGAGFAGNWRKQYKSKDGKYDIDKRGRYTAATGYEGLSISASVAVAEEEGKVKLNVVACDAQVVGLAMKFRNFEMLWGNRILAHIATIKFEEEFGDLMCARLKELIPKNADKIPLLG